MPTWSLTGPFPLDLAAVHASAGLALDDAERVIADGASPYQLPITGAPLRPGLYLLWREEPARALAGFWLVFGPSYLDNGPPGPPDREPPFARELLNAATEAVWWQSLPVWPREGDTWRATIVLEWPPELAARSDAPPPGVVATAPRRATEESKDSGWLDEPAPVQVEEVAPAATAASPYTHLPPSRSLVAIVRAELSQRRGRHAGRFALVDRLPTSPDALPLEAWVGLADETGATPEGAPLALPGGRVGFPLWGWLTRGLRVWPPRPQDARAGSLQERDVGRQWRKQAVRVVASTVGVMVFVLYLAGLVKLAAEPHVHTSPSAPVAEPQPAMSVCSADHEHFVEELRCQLRHFAEGADPTDPICGDPGAGGDLRAGREDLQAAWCGLRDRDLDGWTAQKGVAYADLAAAKACFNVLGHPYSYTAQSAGAVRVDPDRFLRDRDLALRGLVSLVGELDASCNLERGRMQSQIEGAILSTLVGAPASEQVASEPATLRETLVASATAGRARDEAACYRAGSAVGVDAPRSYAELCTHDETGPLPAPTGKGWGALFGDGGAEDASVVARYTRARFGAAGRRHSSSTAPWQCHLELSDRIRREAGAAKTRWDLSAPLPARYEVRQGLVRSQLVLDAALRALAEGGDAGACWQVAARDLARYTPVHPLLGPENAQKWPSPEQQLCGQICAARYRVRSSPQVSAWLTPGADLSMCLTDASPAAEPNFGVGTLDRLSMPWNQASRGAWVPPSADEICAFHLVAQGYFPTDEGGVLVGALAPQVWAGSTATGSALAGGKGGAAVEAAEALSSYGRSRSESTCGYAATQCFVAGGLHVMSDPRSEPYQWLGLWRQWLDGVTPGDTKLTPWCQLVAPYVHADGALPEGQLDYPCASGVDLTRRGVDQALGLLAAGGSASVRP